MSDITTKKLQEAAEAVNQILGKDCGFVLLGSSFDEDEPLVRYASNIEREDVMTILHEQLKYMLVQKLQEDITFGMLDSNEEETIH